jgi:hypothetical protein
MEGQELYICIANRIISKLQAYSLKRVTLAKNSPFIGAVWYDPVGA